jgi:hypothetical protein
MAVDSYHLKAPGQYRKKVIEIDLLWNQNLTEIF